MSSNLVADQNVNWQENETVLPAHMNKIGQGINTLMNLVPVYAANGSFYQNSDYSNSTYTLSPIEFSDESQNVAPTSYFNGMEVVFKSVSANSGDSYVNVNGLGAKQIKTLKNQAITTGTIPQGWVVNLRYDSTQDCFYLMENKGAVGRNVGDIFWTYRTDDSLNGAFDCNGAEYNAADFTGGTNPYDLLVAGSLPALTYADYEAELTRTGGTCNYFGLDTTNQKFKVPKLNTKLIHNSTAPVVGNGMTLGITDGSINAGLIGSGTWQLGSNGGAYGLPYGTNYTGSSALRNDITVGVTTDPTKSGIIADLDNATNIIELRPMVQLATGSDDESLANTTQCLNQLPKKANIIWYADRDFEYKTPDFILADKQYVTIKGGTAIRKKNGEYFYTENDLVKPISEILDTGSVTNGRDYYFYIDNLGNLVASLNESAPVSGNTTNTVQIGGAHTLCVGVTSSNAPALVDTDMWANHPAIGYNAGYFIPNSSWTQAFKSMAKTGNKGQALVNWGSHKFWCDIYLMSGTGTSTASSYQGTITNNRQYQLMFSDLAKVGKMAPSHDEFMILAEGSNQKTAIQGAAIPSGRLTGGYLDTAGKRMISGFFIECCCGYIWQISRDPSVTGSSNWNTYADTNRGGTYGVPYVLALGGLYTDSSNCGSWSRISNGHLLASGVAGGARGVSLHIERQHA